MSQYSSGKQFSPLWRSFEARASLFMCGKRAGHFKCHSGWKKQFSLQRNSCKDGVSLKHPTTPFKPPRRCCEARVGLFKFQKRSRKPFSPQWRFGEARASLFMWGKTTYNAVLTAEVMLRSTCSPLQGSKPTTVEPGMWC